MAKEKIYKLGMADPRSGAERIAGMVNRVASGNRKSPVRNYDDSPAQMAAKRKASAPTGKSAPKRKKSTRGY